jgi:hypothetical protein
VPCCLDFLSEEEVKDVVIEIIRHVEAVETAKRQFFQRVWKSAVGIPVDDRYLIPLDVQVGPIARKLRNCVISDIDDAGILHLNVVRRLEIYVRCDPFKKRL